MILTGRGVGLTIAGAALVAGGFGFGYPELAIVGTTSLIAVGCALVYGAWRPKLSVERAVEPDRVARGEGSTVTLTVHNDNRLLAASLIAEDRCAEVPVAVPVIRLRPRTESTTSYPVPTGRRGVVGIGPLRVTRRDPLGLIGLSRDHGGTAQVWVHPRVHLIRAVPAGISRSMDGRVDRVPHGSITFDTLREYVVGDELRHVHWRTSAKVGELMVREHLDTSLPRLVVLLDDRVGSYPDAAGAAPGAEIAPFEAVCEAAASIVAAAMREDLPISIHTVSGAEAATMGTRARSGARAHLDLLAEATLQPLTETTEAGANAALTQAANRLRQHRPGDTLIYLTGVGGLADLGLVGLLRGPFPTIAVGCLGPAAPDEPPTSGAAAGLLMLRAEDGLEFAAEWDGVRRW
ncbi:uncharacterized protein (DUF58 family) [Allocatelliglobosispora scoriae]|uniref:Uncharacterized protein (DUF58 family) n=1 Tax=Allocatelliglobosispora scoriae TaxID=643052 RepID=A0A841BPD3_9ACTN|nr:DUF58 domain-containing protein [Allocatelliglobosispora scoriae]MBB5869166.1 uncharacterized protein (DUF58 family) [Allocatelliglobosispora scoriae]